MWGKTGTEVYVRSGKVPVNYGKNEGMRPEWNVAVLILKATFFPEAHDRTFSALRKSESFCQIRLSGK
jgi:hypothetical protein